MRIKKEWERVFKELSKTVRSARPASIADKSSGQIAWRNNGNTFMFGLIVDRDDFLRITSHHMPWQKIEKWTGMSRAPSNPFELTFLPSESIHIYGKIIAFTEAMQTTGIAPDWPLFSENIRGGYPEYAYTVSAGTQLDRYLSSALLSSGPPRNPIAMAPVSKTQSNQMP